MKAVAEKVRKYYKNVIVESDYIRPNITSNGNMGGDSFAVTSGAFPWTGNSGAYQMFDGNTSTSAHSTNHNGGDYVEWYNPNPLKVTNVVCSAGYSGDWFNVTFKGSNDGTNWTDVAYFAHGVRQNCPVNSPDFYKYWMMYNNSGFSHDGHGYGGGIGEVYITGIEKIEGIEESTEADYDFYKDIYEYSLPTDTERKYYKYVYEPWKQPVISSNGEIGHGDFAVAVAPSIYGAGYDICYAFDNRTDTCWISAGNPVVTIYSKLPLNITDIKIRNRTGFNYAITGYTIEGSSDNVTYTQLKTGNNSTVDGGAEWNIPMDYSGYYKYYKLNVTSTNNGYAEVSEITITATQQDTVISTSTDYDFYQDISTYYAIKSYEKGQYYGN